MTRILAITALAVFAIFAGFTLWLVWPEPGDDQFAECRKSRVAGGGGSIGGPFTLIDGAGAEVTDSDVFAKPSLLYFGYTYCPDVCPLDVARNADAVDLLKELGYDSQPVFISIDPERDTPEVVADYAESLHEDMIALTGSPDQVKAASKAYRTYYRKRDGDEEFYLVDHSTFTYLVMPETGFAEFFRRDATPEQVAEAVACLVDAS